MELWNTVLTLKENHERLGLKGAEFFIHDFPYNLQTDTLDYVIAQPAFTGTGVSKGLGSWLLSDEQVKELFDVSEKTLHDIGLEMEADYWERFYEEYED